MYGTAPYRCTPAPHIAHTMSMKPNDEKTTLKKDTVLTHPSFHGWNQIKLNEESVVRAQIRGIFRHDRRPWTTVHLISNSPSAEIMLMNVLQQELDDTSCPDGYRTTCLKCLLALSKARNIVPSSFSSRNVVKEGTNPICGGGFADIWKGRLQDAQVCLKVLRLFIPEKAREKLLRDFCQETLVWRQLRHPNILPFLGVSEELFAPSYCLISLWMINGNIMSYLEAHPDQDRLKSLVQVVEGMKYLHNHDPPIVHADIRGANILVMDDLSCCLADFGLSLFVESRALNSSSWRDSGCIRWLAPEYMDSTLFNQTYFTARDVYAYGCTVVEIFTGEPPFSNIKNDAGVIYEVLTKQSLPPRPASNIFLDDGLWELVIACLSTMSSRRPNAEQISEILAQLQTTSGTAFKLDQLTNASFNTEDISFSPPVLVNQDLYAEFEPLPDTLTAWGDLDTKPLIIDDPSSSSLYSIDPFVGPTLDDELFVPWTDDAVIVPRVVQDDGNSAQGASPDINVSDGLEIVNPTVISPIVVQCKGSPSTPATSTTLGEVTPTRQSHSANQTTPSSGKRSRSSSSELPASPSIPSTNPTLRIHLEPLQASEGIDVPHAKRIRVGEPETLL
ncbi:kinase-like domain-containing protein [Armillaria mellea]|nr:kinase-like domain-containing protein [Armillaria mellea]